MTALSFAALSEKLPAGGIEFVGNNQIKANFSQIVEADSGLTLEDSCVSAIVKLLDGLSALTDQVNEQRIQANQPPVEFCSKTLTGTPEQPEYEFKLRIKVDTSHFADNLDDPTD